MEGQSNVLLIILLFILRLGIPVLVTVAIAYGLHRLDARWQAEAEAKAQTKVVAPLAPQPQSARTGASAGNGSGINIPLRQPVALAAGQPCWSIKGCSESMRATCAAFHQPNVPCWSARMNAEGRLPAGCKDCKVYQPTASVWTEQGLILH